MERYLRVPHNLVKLIFSLRGQNKVGVRIPHKETLPGYLCPEIVDKRCEKDTWRIVNICENPTPKSYSLLNKARYFAGLSFNLLA